MKTIWKFPLATTDMQAIWMPENAVVLHVQTQNEIPCIWAEVDDKARASLRHFVTVGTGNPFPGETVLEYIGTYQLAGGALVFHVFEDTGVFIAPQA